jgi:hypothetical protein
MAVSCELDKETSVSRKEKKILDQKYKHVSKTASSVLIIEPWVS